jgi:hypothetical protein
MARTDTHRPSQINPEDYEFVAFEYLKIEDISDAQFLMSERARIRAHMECTGGQRSNHEHGGNCHVCGSVNAIYTALFHHKPSNVYIRTGLDCTEKLDSAVNGDVFRRNVRTALEARAGKRKALATLEAAGIAAAWAIYMGPEGRDSEGTYSQRADRREENTICDILSRLVKYGSISPGQINYVRSLLERIANRATIAAARAAEAAVAKPVPMVAGRATVRGKVLTIREPDEYAPFPQRKILVVHADGWKVWGSLPAALSDVKVGEMVEFSAALTRSDKDEKFGFFSRPSKAKILEAA